ncbi:MAG: protein kinase [Candidatus Marinimicrobia bacterium]|nr:protein kinase [Candidatus Neomarinimicrobiota bacterium]
MRRDTPALGKIFERPKGMKKNIQIDKLISHYRIIEKLGEGGMGVVYKAEDTKLKRTVALKFLPPELTRNEEAKERFIHEAQAASGLEHNNICNIHEIDETEDGQTFIVMACYEGETVKEKVEQGPLKLGASLDIAIQVAEGLAKAYEQGIVHRDIKSANLYVTKDDVVKILDFGLAKLCGQTNLTREGTTLGTVAYMSPEQARGEVVDHRTDIWSLGVVLYEMVTGQLPFKGDYEQAVMYSIMNEAPEPVTGLRTGVPMELERITNKALAKSPGERYQHVDEIMVDLKSLCDKLKSRAKEQPTITTTPAQSKKKFLFEGVACLFLIALIALYFLFLSKPPSIERKSIAVLPFKNMVPDPENEWFSDGITEDIITHLSKIGDLKVISRTSVMLYKDSKKNLREIGKELGVATILEGSVRRADNRVRIVSQLVDARTDKHIWAETYDRNLKDIFAIQSDVAQKIASALKATLSPEEKERIEQKPTDNLEAYDYFLQGREYAFRSYARKDLEIAIELFEKAIKEDPDFAEAYASMAHQHCRIFWFGHDRTQERLAKAKEAIDKALNLKPDEPLVRVANGYYYYYGFRDYARALDEFSFAQRKEPGNALYNASIAYIQRRLGKFEDALQNLKIAFQYDPRLNSRAWEVGVTYRDLRMYTEAEGYFDRAITLAPDIAENYIYKAGTRIYKMGTTESARQVLDNASKRVDLEDFIWTLVYFDIYDGHYQDALNRLASIQEEVNEGQTVYTPKDAIRGLIFELMGQPDQAVSHYKKARTLLEKMVRERPDDARIHAELGKVYAHLGLRDEAIHEGKTAVDLIPVSRDAMIGSEYLANLAEIYTIVGDYNASIDRLEYLVTIPAGIHIGALKINPVWNPLREHPRFQRLLEGEK